jgi:hypothetical protein
MTGAGESNMATNPTLGPWTIATVNAGHANPNITALGIVGADSTIIARMPAEYRKHHAVWPLTQANARLIAHAPAMLELLKCYIGAHKSMTPMTLERYDTQARAILRAVAGVTP